jgi:dihydroflavonol-4-reductase
MLTVVTGASGHIGCNLVRGLLAAGRRVRALVFRDERGLAGLECERAHGDVLDEGSLAAAFAGADVVYHCAANISVDGSVRDDQLRVNVLGPRNVAAACLAAGVGRLVHFSSVHALSEHPLAAPVTEANGLVTDDQRPLPYSRSKALGEKEIRAAVERGLDAVIVNPTGVIGPHDYKVSHMGETIRDLACGRLPALIPGGYDFVDVRDVVAGAQRAEQAGRPGERYLLSGNYLTVAELAALVCQVTGVPAPRLTCPMWVARAVAPLSAAWGKVRGARPKFTSASLQVLRSNGRTDCSKAERELSYTRRPALESIAATVEWQRSAGWHDRRSRA